MDRPTRIIDDPTVREVYSNRIACASYDGAVVVFALACLRNVGERVGDKADHNEAVINNRLCIPEAIAVDCTKSWALRSKRCWSARLKLRLPNLGLFVRGKSSWTQAMTWGQVQPLT